MAFKDATQDRASNSFALRVIFTWLHKADEKNLRKVCVLEAVARGETTIFLAMRVFLMW